MKLLFLAKRRPQQRDLIERPYGRFFHLPRELAARGHTVQTILLDHRRTEAIDVERDGVQWRTYDFLSDGPLRYWRELERNALQLKPDWIVGCSDLYYGVLATKLARRCGARAAIDAYDNFESYASIAKPLHWLWHHALARADLVTAAGPELAELLQRHSKQVHVLPMAADPHFAPQERGAARAQLQLPANALLIGHCGSFTASRGSEILLAAFDRVREQIPDARLLLTGRYPRELDARAGVIGRGMVDDDRMPSVLASLDVACVLLADTAFGRYSYPAKLYEAMACRIPLVASATSPARWILGDREQHLARVGDAADLAAKLLDQLRNATCAYPPQPSWTQIAGQFESLLAR